MKLRIFTGMLLVAFLSFFNSLTASAHNGCKGDDCCKKTWRHARWGHQSYYYGPDGQYAKNKKSCCDKSEKSSCSEGKKCCSTNNFVTENGTYRRARYNQNCCGNGYLSADNKNND